MARTPENKEKTRASQRPAAGSPLTERYPRKRGRRAERPGELTGKGWRDVLLRVKNQIGEDNLSVVAAGVAFYAFLAIFPAIAAAVSIYGLMVDPQTVQQQLTEATEMLPEQARQILAGQLQRVSSGAAQALGWGLALSIAELTDLKLAEAYYFVVADNEGVGRRLWFLMASDDPQTPFSFIAGGDSRSNRFPRKQGNRLAGKLRPLFILFAGDFIKDASSHSQWQNWLEDWQLTIAEDRRILPIVPAQGQPRAYRNCRKAFQYAAECRIRTILRW